MVLRMYILKKKLKGSYVAITQATYIVSYKLYTQIYKAQMLKSLLLFLALLLMQLDCHLQDY